MHTSGIRWLFTSTQTKSSSPLATDAQVQQGFIDERAPLNTMTVDPSRTVDKGEDEDERDDDMSEPTQTTENRKAKRVSDGRNSKRVTGIVTHN